MSRIKMLIVTFLVGLLFISGCGREEAKPAQTTQTDNSPVQEQQPSQSKLDTPAQQTPEQKSQQGGNVKIQQLPQPEQNTNSQKPGQPPQNAPEKEKINYSLTVGAAFPSFTLTDLNGGAVSSKDLFNNRITLINIWSTT
ncbi:hypothetical protein L7E55_13900 [Pelotomaculum isophthalicicum JI]|uniref:Uncharacterized protein n=1 Tax=Pelotomaculum isophthalicicum JI TaxID=947010 RepID=A0A9X4H375_9FIRM|nr:hypothetical protein [Pelotomaculum isophthalicicum]MDF9409435.1 hypothetical protein [Pelotomaculum isophthalicicum JI]